MLKRTSALAVMALMLVLGASATAQAVTLGSTTFPVGSGPSGCGTDTVIAQKTDPAGLPYRVPGSGTITQWQINSGPPSTPGSPVTFMILRPTGTGATFTVVAADSRTTPSPAPAGGVATFTLSAPVPVTGNETLGLWTDSPASTVCYSSGGMTSLAATLTALGSMNAPVANQGLSPTSGDSPGGYQLNAAATFVPTPPKKKKCKKKKKKKGGTKDASAAKKKKCKKKKKKGK